MLIHTPPAPNLNFNCRHCNASFRRSHDLQRHEKTRHSDSKPFKCIYCPAAFKRRDSWRKHMEGEEAKAMRGARSKGWASGNGDLEGQEVVGGRQGEDRADKDGEEAGECADNGSSRSGRDGLTAGGDEGVLRAETDTFDGDGSQGGGDEKEEEEEEEGGNSSSSEQ
ncbi:hypothetical protein HDU67_007503, partial [Dinochytrium kinnereticum]